MPAFSGREDKSPSTTIGLDLYFLGLERDNVTFNGTSGDEDRYTIGGRLGGKVGESALTYDVEGAYQFGEVGSDDISAGMFSFELAYPLTDVWGKPKVAAGHDWASGDDGAGGDVETFNQLFPLGHAYLGYIDLVGRQNIIDWHMGVTMTPIEKMTLGLTGHIFWRAEDTDALYNAGGGVVRPGGGSSSKEVGSEIDLTIKYKFNRHIVGLLGYSHFFAGDFIEDTGPSSDIDFVYAQVQYTF